MLQIQVVVVLSTSQIVIIATQERTEWVAKVNAQLVSMVVEEGKRTRKQLVHPIAHLEHLAHNGEAYKVVDALERALLESMRYWMQTLVNTFVTLKLTLAARAHKDIIALVILAILLRQQRNAR